jgi:hypothetical protein
MLTNFKRALRLLPVVAIILEVGAAQAAASAQPLPSYAVQEQTIHGTVAHFDGQYTMYVYDDRGYTDRVLLHQGTVINPTGIRLESGFAVTIAGHPSGNAFIANEIDTPYHYRAYYGYGRPYYGPVIGLGFGFGRPYGYGYGYRGYRGWR